MRRASETGGVIVNADSQQLYDGLQVLTARPSPADEAALPHRLYGVADPSDSWSVGRWLTAVQGLLMSEPGPLVIVGGTGLYFHALLRGLAPVPPVPDAVRQTIEAEWLETGEAAVRRRLADLDPGAERRVAAGDRQRLVRALAVAVSTGRTLSDWQADSAPATLLIQDCELWVVERERQELYRRCDARVDQMFETGAIDEVATLLARNLAPDRPAMLAVGVREIAAVLKGEASLDDAREQTKQATRRYAKRQLTWFRNQTPGWPRLSLSKN